MGPAVGRGRAPRPGGLMDLYSIPTPQLCHRPGRLEDNCRILAGVMERTGCKIPAGSEGFLRLLPVSPDREVSLPAPTASGLYEARLGREELGKEPHVFSPAYREAEFDELADLCDHIVLQLRGPAAQVPGTAAGTGASACGSIPGAPPRNMGSMTPALRAAAWA